MYVELVKITKEKAISELRSVVASDMRFLKDDAEDMRDLTSKNIILYGQIIQLIKDQDEELKNLKIKILNLAEEVK